MTSTIHRASGCLFGLAFGDALGATTEFESVGRILYMYPPAGPTGLAGNPARVTDDTQMAIAVGQALLQSPRPFTPTTLEPELRRNFVQWLRSPDNNRAPGNTCMAACRRLASGESWLLATVLGSKGCGANMRVAPVGLLTQARDGVDEPTRAAIAQFQAALTHGHATALAASDLTAFAVADLFLGGEPAGLPRRLCDYANSQRTMYHGEWLGTLWQRSGSNSPAEFISVGWDECLAALDRLDAGLESADRKSDPCLATGAGWIAEEALATGAGWIAEEALATGLLCFLLFPDDPVAAIRRAAVSSGDSDSIACLAGAFAGAHLGLSVWPQDWVTCIEYHTELEVLGAAWD